MKWKYFTFMQIREALAWAAQGNVAVHATGVPFRQHEYTAHLFAKDEANLRAAAARVGVRHKLQKRKSKLGYTDHFDLYGKTLIRALELCEE